MLNNLKKISVLIFIALLLLSSAIFYFAKSKTTKVTTEIADIVISNAKVVTMDENYNIYDPGFIVVKDSKIVSVGQGDASAHYSAKKVIDANGKVVMPGLINTHAHAAMSLLTGLIKDQPLEFWLSAVEKYENKMNSDQVYWGSMLAGIKMVKSGTTMVNDMYFNPESGVKAFSLLGIRSFVRFPEKEGGVDKNLVQSYESNRLVNFANDPNPLLGYSFNDLKNISRDALKNNDLIHIHFAEDAQARKDSEFKFSLSPLQLITQTGLVNNKIILAHAVDLSDSEIGELSKYKNVSVSFNPLSEQNLYTPLTPANKMLQAGINVSLGTDGEPSSNLDMFAQMKLASEKEKLSPKIVMQMATLNGAKALGKENELGSLEKGKFADLIIIDYKGGSDVYSNIVYNTSGQDVLTSIISGKIVMENKILLNVDEQDSVKKAQNLSSKIQDLFSK